MKSTADFSHQLRNAMLSAGFNQVALAKAIGKSKSLISQYLSGNALPKEETLRKIEKVLDCSFKTNDEKEEPLKVSVSQCARMLGKSEPFIRAALQEGTASFGFAVKTSNKWDYHISPYLLKQYVGADTFNKYI